MKSGDILTFSQSLSEQVQEGMWIAIFTVVNLLHHVEFVGIPRMSDPIKEYGNSWGYFNISWFDIHTYIYQGSPSFSQLANYCIGSFWYFSFYTFKSVEMLNHFLFSNFRRAGLKCDQLKCRSCIGFYMVFRLIMLTIWVNVWKQKRWKLYANFGRWYLIL